MSEISSSDGSCTTGNVGCCSCHGLSNVPDDHSDGSCIAVNVDCCLSKGLSNVPDKEPATGGMSRSNC